ncbi:MAG: 3'-5' exoribonuclease [Candidatus Omnitrophica bacterium]|nr:3'-5' exoribonuclease [Candidatus Omnitrophota bacterium]
MQKNNPQKEVYVSTDIETDGPIPGEFSMLSFGSAAFTAQKEKIATFTVNLQPLPGARQDPETMKWWETQKTAWEESRRDPETPQDAMKKYLRWLKDLPAKPVFVGYPASFDFMFINWYLIKFTGENPFSFVALDIKTYAMAILKKPFLSITKSSMPKHWFDESAKSHIALNDAIEQGWLFCNMLKENADNLKG